MKYEDIFTLDNLEHSAYKCMLSVGWKGSVQFYRNNLITNLQKLKAKLDKPIYKAMPFYEFEIMERGKQRHIKSLHISERTIQKCLCENYLTALITKRLIYDNGACIKGKGVDFSKKRFVKHLRAFWLNYGTDGYVLVFDFSKYFENIDHDILIAQLEKIVDDEKVLSLLKVLIKDFGDKGLGLGSEISQLLALYYPNKIDRYIKEEAKIKYYGRYMDDGYLLCQDKKYLVQVRNNIFRIAKELKIIINEKKTFIGKISNGITWLKTRYVLSENGKIYKKPFKKSVVKMRRKLKKFKQNGVPIKKIEQCYNSWLSYIIKTNSYHTIKNMNKLKEKIFMAIKRETLKNGLVRTYSDEGFKIINVKTGQIFEEAIDLTNFMKEYEETDLLIENEEEYIQ